MMISLHGGICCGIKHIHNLGGYPEGNLAARDALPEDKTSFFPNALRSASTDMRSSDRAKSHLDFYNEAAPLEKGHERFSRMVAFMKEHRPHHMIEVVLSGNQTAWHKYLKAHHFRKVSEFYNSNTGATLTVWHLTY